MKLVPAICQHLTDSRKRTASKQVFFAIRNGVLVDISAQHTVIDVVHMSKLASATINYDVVRKRTRLPERIQFPPDNLMLVERSGIVPQKIAKERPHKRGEQYLRK